MSALKTQPNEKRCRTTTETHILPLKPCCPYSGNPTEGSKLFIEYRANDVFLEVISLREYVDSYVGGRGDVRSMEGMIQQIAQDCANAVQTGVHVKAVLNMAAEQSERMLNNRIERGFKVRLAPKPTLRQWTFETRPEGMVWVHSKSDTTYEILVSAWNQFGGKVGDWGYVTYETLFTDWLQRDGKPCGTEEGGSK